MYVCGDCDFMFTEPDTEVKYKGTSLVPENITEQHEVCPKCGSMECIERDEDGPPYDAATRTGMYDRGDIPQ